MEGMQPVRSAPSLQQAFLYQPFCHHCAMPRGSLCLMPTGCCLPHLLSHLQQRQLDQLQDRQRHQMFTSHLRMPHVDRDWQQPCRREPCRCHLFSERSCRQSSVCCHASRHSRVAPCCDVHYRRWPSAYSALDHREPRAHLDQPSSVADACTQWQGTAPAVQMDVGWFQPVCDACAKWQETTGGSSAVCDACAKWQGTSPAVETVVGGSSPVADACTQWQETAIAREMGVGCSSPVSDACTQWQQTTTAREMGVGCSNPVSDACTQWHQTTPAVETVAGWTTPVSDACTQWQEATTARDMDASWSLDVQVESRSEDISPESTTMDWFQKDEVRQFFCQVLLLCLSFASSSVHLFLIYMSNIWIDVVSRVRPSIQPDGCPSYMAKHLMLDITYKLFNQVLSCLPCLQAPLTSTIYCHFSVLDLSWASQGQRKAKPLGFIFFYTFQFIRMKFDVDMKQFKLNILRLLLSKIITNKSEQKNEFRPNSLKSL